MEIRLIDLINNKVDVRNYMFIHEGKIMVNAQHVYDVILDTEKDRLHQQMELFDSREEMFKKAKAFDEIVIETTGAIMNCPPGVVETEAGKLTLDIIDKYEKQTEVEK
ncbi:hypothetical protein [Mammaliicoccus sciuri]|uniref:hypothetical protein n=1 Tax=Mammaliicoccus sciuri TaxID=1296 RepID=UPI0021D25023|nr:hypothetical protein [Mammaliicoccus sciuri]UXU93159.1 hypothetical protein MUA42_10925 [Mammaliicoccus sciuri]UXV15109.1 hypothetical protein MUA89_11190 [Mammaliicoccus sciuri]